MEVSEIIGTAVSGIVVGGVVSAEFKASVSCGIFGRIEESVESETSVLSVFSSVVISLLPPTK
ncbi:MAG: hypothetical protein FWD71_10970 [Oscillospiraceae bacterium]|nr:hypothetical protein [Oscillospiraceae bacterium]